MEYKDQIKELRKRIPIPVQEALVRLKATQGNVDFVEKEFIEKSVATICAQTNVASEMALILFKEHKHDLNKTISSIHEEQYDLEYSQPPSLTKEKLIIVAEWLRIEDHEGLEAALGYQFDSIIETLLQMPALTDLVQAFQAVRKQWLLLIEEYEDVSSIEADMERSTKLRSSAVFQNCEELLSQQVHMLEKELNRHSRNLK